MIQKVERGRIIRLYRVDRYVDREVTVRRKQKRKKCSRWESNPRPLVHKTNDLPIDLQEHP